MHARQIGDLTSPLFDVVSREQREILYQNPVNSIHISVPKGPQPAQKAGQLVTQWKQDRTLVQDAIPGLYVYYQYFTLPGDPEPKCRKGFIALIRIHDWQENVVLRHENTMPVSVKDRSDILDATQFNVSPTHGIYVEDNPDLERYLDEAIQNPIYETEDYQGVRDVLAVIQDQKIIQKFSEVLSSKNVILADGHHRYAGSIEYQKQRERSNEHHTGEEGYNFHMMYLTNARTDTVRILPTHRLLSGISDFDPEDVLEKLSEFFVIKHVINPNDINEVILGKKWAFGLLMGDQAYKIRLKPEAFDLMDWNFPDEIKRLDLTVLHYFVIDRVLGIPGRKQTKSDQITFERNFTNCHDQVISGKAQLALITRDITMEEVLRVCESGYTLPQKSTYFYPKVICGFLFGSILDDEFAPYPEFSL